MSETRKVEKSPEELYQEREQRFMGAVQLKITDRVPVALRLGYFPAKYKGITCLTSLFAMVPFDIISDRWRGIQGAMLDMYRRPDKLLRILEPLVPKQIERAVMPARKSISKRVFMPLHRGSDGFMNLKQFETFYWPHFKRIVLGLVEAGLTPCPFLEGIWDQRLEYLMEFPRGKVLCHFAQTDMFKAKEILRDHLCLMGNVPSSILQFGSVQDVEDYCKKLIEVCGKGGGFVMTHMPIDEAKPENVQAMVDFTKRYGVYS